MKEMDALINEGKKLYSEKAYADALVIFEDLWENSDKTNPTILGFLGLSLRKNKKPEAFVDICRDLRCSKKLIKVKLVSSTLCWCLYDAHIKAYDAKKIDEFADFLKRAEYIVQSISQLESVKFCYNPYVLTVMKVVKVYRDKASTNWKEVISWLSKLDQQELPNDVFEIENNGNIRELASPKEFFYQYITKALEKSEKFEECISYCEEALEKVEKFHYRNKLWFQARLHYCKCMLSNEIEVDLEKYKTIAYRENYWYMYHKLAQICLRNNMVDDSLFYASKAIVAKFEYEKMVNLFFDIAQLWEMKFENSKAILFYSASAYYRERQGWYLSEELRFAIAIYDIDVYKKPDIGKIKEVAKKYVSEIEDVNKVLGRIHSILPHGKAGFISLDESKNNVYFRLSDVNNSKGLKKDDIVKFEIILQDDGRTKAINIEKGK